MSIVRMPPTRANLWGHPAWEKVRAFREAGLVVDSIVAQPYEKILLHVPAYESTPLAVDAAGNVTVDTHNPAYAGRTAAGWKTNRERNQILHEACQSLVSDLYGCASHLNLTFELRDRGWQCYEGLYGDVTISAIDNDLALKARVFGREVARIEGQENSTEFSRARLSRVFARLEADVASIHSAHENGTSGDIGAYLAIAEESLVQSFRNGFDDEGVL